MLKNKKMCGLILSSLIILLIVIAIDPFDLFLHGYFIEEINFNEIPTEDFLDSVNIEEMEYEMTFSPQKHHMAGVELFLTNQPEENTGTLRLNIFNKKGHKIDEIDINLSEVRAASWYKVYFSAKLKKGEEYTLQFSAIDCDTVPYLQNVPTDYLPDETITGNLLMSYAYKKPTFTLQNKLLIVLYLISFWCVGGSFLINEKLKKYILTSGVILFLTAVLAWNYMYNSMNNQNIQFPVFQEESEVLVAGVIYADQVGVDFSGEGEKWAGLGRYHDLRGSLFTHGMSFCTEDNWVNGYSKTEPSILVMSNVYSKEVATVGNYILFENGEKYQIVNIVDNNDRIEIQLDTDKVLTSLKNGNLEDAVFIDAEGKILPSCKLTSYTSQYGLQGKIFKHLARYMNNDEAILNLNLLCSIGTALVFSLIVFFLSKKYNKLIAACFFTTFWLSPWIVNFARNLYWVEFTWFIPMAVGLFCAWKINSRKCRITSYIITFVSIAVKSLCGYEYISSVMMGMICFLLVDFIHFVAKKDRKQALLLIRTIVVMGVAAMMGFILAICIHAVLRGQGNILVGIKNIVLQDALRRTSGGNLNEFDAVYWPSFNSSIWDVISTYFRFNTEIVTGLAGNLFPLLATIPLAIFGYEFLNRKVNIELLATYGVFFFTTISWFCLAKSHSFIHTHMSYVLWYFGFIQVCFYIIINKIVQFFKDIKQIREP